jgi:hypothetical protein
MKKLCLLALLVFTFFSVTTAQAAVEYLGEVCLELRSIGTNGILQTLRLGILSYGTDTFPIHGKRVIPISGGFVSEPIHGTGVLSGNSLQMSLNASIMDYGPLSATYSISLNMGTFTGNFGLITVEASAFMLPTPVLKSTGGTVTVQACR